MIDIDTYQLFRVRVSVSSVIVALLCYDDNISHYPVSVSLCWCQYY